MTEFNEEEKLPEQSYGVWLSSLLLENKELTNTEKIIFGMIQSFANKYGYCFATNKTIGDLTGLSARKTSLCIVKLKALGFVDTVMTYKKDSKGNTTKEINQRLITIEKLW